MVEERKQVRRGNHFDLARPCSFRALGSGQSPRGAKNEENRPDIILVDIKPCDCRVPRPKGKVPL